MDPMRLLEAAAALPAFVPPGTNAFVILLSAFAGLLIGGAGGFLVSLVIGVRKRRLVVVIAALLSAMFGLSVGLAYGQMRNIAGFMAHEASRRNACERASGEIAIGTVASIPDPLLEGLLGACGEAPVLQAAASRQSAVEIVEVYRREGDRVLLRRSAVPRAPS